MSAFAEELKEALRVVIREELPALLAEQNRPAAAAHGDDRRLVGVEEAARFLGISTSTVYKRAESCRLPSVKDGGRRLFKIADLIAYSEERRRTPAQVARLANDANGGR